MNPRDREQQENEVATAQRMQRHKETWTDEFFWEKDALLWQAFKDTPLGKKKALVNIHHAAKSLDALRQEVQTVMDTGKMAQAALDQDLDTNQ